MGDTKRKSSNPTFQYVKTCEHDCIGYKAEKDEEQEVRSHETILHNVVIM